MLITQDSEIVKSFVNHLKELMGIDIKIDSIPEEINSGDIDAIAGTYAIEHTSIDTIKDQRRDGDWFSQSIDGLELYFKNKLDYRLTIYIEYDGVRKGQNWKSNKKILKAWIENISGNIDFGKNMVIDVDGINFSLRVHKDPKERLGTGVRFARILSQNFDPKNEIPPRLKQLINTKLNKLGKYANYTKVLLIENSDIALMNNQLMMNVINEALDGCLPNEVNELWYADSSRYPIVNFEKVTINQR